MNRPLNFCWNKLLRLFIFATPYTVHEIKNPVKISRYTVIMHNHAYFFCFCRFEVLADPNHTPIPELQIVLGSKNGIQVYLKERNVQSKQEWIHLYIIVPPANEVWGGI